MKTEVVENFPEYMVYYAYYGEPGGDVTDEDIKLFEEWRKREGYGNCLGLADDNAFADFDSHPAFGLACDTIPVVFEVLEKGIQNSRQIKSSKLSYKEISNLSHKIARDVINGKYSEGEAIEKVMKETGWSYGYADAAVASWIENEPTYNGTTMTSSRKPVKSSLMDEVMNFETTEDLDIYLRNKGYERRDGNGFFEYGIPNQPAELRVTEDNGGFIVDIKALTNSRRPVKSGRYQVVTYKTYGGDDGYKERIEFDNYDDAEHYANDIRYSHKGVGIFDLEDKLLVEKMGDFPWTPEGGFTYSPKLVEDAKRSLRWFYGDDEEADRQFEIWKRKNNIKSARYIATDPESGEVLGSADTYEEAINEWGEDVTITDSKATEEVVSSRQIKSSNRSSYSPVDTLNELKEKYPDAHMTDYGTYVEFKIQDYLFDIDYRNNLVEMRDKNYNTIHSDKFDDVDDAAGSIIGLMDMFADETIRNSRQIKSFRKITSAVDGGWEVRSSDVPEALDLFVEYFGEEDALEQIAKAMSSDTLEENIDWIAQQWGFAEDLEEYDDAWDKYEYAKEVMGESELFNNLTQAAGYDELAEDLAFIFRMNDFQEWNKYDEPETVEVDENAKDFAVYSILCDIEESKNGGDGDKARKDAQRDQDQLYDYELQSELLEEYENAGGTYTDVDEYGDAEFEDTELAIKIFKTAIEHLDEYENRDDDDSDLEYKEWLNKYYPIKSSRKINSSKTDDPEELKAALKEIEDAIDNAGDYDDIEEMEKERQEILDKMKKHSDNITSSLFYITYYGTSGDGYVGFDNEPTSDFDQAMTFPSREEADARRFELQKDWDSELQVEEFKDEIDSARKHAERKILTNIVSSVLTGRITEEQAAEKIASANDCNTGYARNLLAQAMKDKSYIRSGTMDIAGDVNKEFDIDGDFESWTGDYVPRSGKASTVGGEILRAANTIDSRYYNDGDRIGIGMGKETVNPAARYLLATITDSSMEPSMADIKDMLGNDSEVNRSADYYEEWLEEFKHLLEDYLRDNEELFHTVNDEDMQKYREEGDTNTSVEECYIEEDGIRYWFERDEDGWTCNSIETEKESDYDVGDIIEKDTPDFDLIENPEEEFGDFETNGFTYSWEFNSDATGDYYEITDVKPVNTLAEEGDWWENFRFESYQVYDSDGNEISEADLY